MPSWSVPTPQTLNLSLGPALPQASIRCAISRAQRTGTRQSGQRTSPHYRSGMGLRPRLLERAPSHVPAADLPVFQVSLDHSRTFSEHVELGGELHHLRDRGVLIIGSGNLVHNLHRMNWDMPHTAYPWAEGFDKKSEASHRKQGSSVPRISRSLGKITARRRSPRHGALRPGSLHSGQYQPR